jgi:hypothetical protein
MKKLMAKKTPRKSSKTRLHRVRERVMESDASYFLKLVAVVLMGTFWLKLGEPAEWGWLKVTALPVGLAVGLLAVRAFEHRQADRKIWYAVLLIVGVISSFLPAGIVI